MKYIVTSLILLCTMAATARVPDFRFTVIVTDGTNSQNLILGADTTATASYDPGFDILAPPMPPAGAFGASLEWQSESYYQDIRDTLLTVKEFVLNYQPEAGRNITLSWDTTGIAQFGTFILTDAITGTLFTLDMHTATSLNTASSSLTLNRVKVTFTPRPPNRPPLAVADIYAIPEDTELIQDVTTNDSDPDNEPLDVIFFENPVHGNLLDAGSGIFQYTPDPDFFGLDSFHYILSDGTAFTDTSAVFITVTAVNDRPIARNDTLSGNEDVALIIDVLANDWDIDDTDLTILSVSGSNNGQVSIRTDGALDFVPEPDFYGVVPLDYIIADTSGARDTAKVIITLVAVPDPPVAVNDNFVLQEDQGTVLPVLDNDSDADGDPLVILGYSTPLTGSITGVSGDTALIYLPAENFYGADTLEYTVGDGTGYTASAFVYIQLMAVNDPPEINLMESLAFPSDSTFTIDLWNYVSDPDSPDSLLQFNYWSEPDTLLLSFSTPNGHLSIEAEDSSYPATAKLFVIVTDDWGASTIDSVAVQLTQPTGIISAEIMPEKFELLQNYPNPFNPLTRIEYDVPYTALVRIEVFNILGERVTILVNNIHQPGRYILEFPAGNLPAGIYFCRMRSNRFNQVRRMILLK